MNFLSFFLFHRLSLITFSLTKERLLKTILVSSSSSWQFISISFLHTILNCQKLSKISLPYILKAPHLSNDTFKIVLVNCGETHPPPPKKDLKNIKYNKMRWVNINMGSIAHTMASHTFQCVLGERRRGGGLGMP